jgi:hypothetical protein
MPTRRGTWPLTIPCIVLGVVLATAGWVAWYHFARSTSQTGTVEVPAVHVSNSREGLIVDQCQLNTQGTQANAYGIFDHNAVASYSTWIGMAVFHGDVVLGAAKSTNTDVTSGGASGSQ